MEHERERAKHHLLLGSTFLTDTGGNILRHSGRQSLSARKSLTRADGPTSSTFTMEFEVDDDCPPVSASGGNEEDE